MISRFGLLSLLTAVLLLAAGNSQCCTAAAGAIRTATDSKTEQASPAVKSADTQQKKEPATASSGMATTAKPQLDMNSLIERLKQTKAIGVLTKLVLRSDVSDLIDEVKLYKRTRGSTKQLDRIKAHFNGLLLKVLALLNDDPKLAQDIQCARDNLWQHLMEVKA